MAIRTVDAKTLKCWMESGEAVVVDVREPAEHAAEKIQGTTLLPLTLLNKALLPEINGKKLVIHCHSGKRGANACTQLLAEDPDMEVYNLEGGITAWGAAGQPIISSGNFFLPLDQQVHLVIGLGVLTASLLAYFVNPLFFLLTGLFGTGLVFAGLTGFCGLAIVMAKMPWNRQLARGMTSCKVKAK